MLDVKEQIDLDVSLAQSGSRTSDATGSSSDISEFHAASVLINVDDWTDGTHEFQVEESDDDSSWSAVADDDLDGDEPSVSEAGDEGKHRIGYTGNKRYLRVTTSVSGTTTGADYGVYILKGDPSQFPAN